MKKLSLACIAPSTFSRVVRVTLVDTNIYIYIYSTVIISLSFNEIDFKIKLTSI